MKRDGAKESTRKSLPSGYNSVVRFPHRNIYVYTGVSIDSHTAHTHVILWGFVIYLFRVLTSNSIIIVCIHFFKYFLRVFERGIPSFLTAEKIFHRTKAINNNNNIFGLIDTPYNTLHVCIRDPTRATRVHCVFVMGATVSTIIF